MSVADASTLTKSRALKRGLPSLTGRTPAWGNPYVTPLQLLRKPVSGISYPLEKGGAARCVIPGGARAARPRIPKPAGWSHTTGSSVSGSSGEASSPFWGRGVAESLPCALGGAFSLPAPTGPALGCRGRLGAMAVPTSHADRNVAGSGQGGPHTRGELDLVLCDGVMCTYQKEGWCRELHLAPLGFPRARPPWPKGAPRPPSTPPLLSPHPSPRPYRRSWDECSLSPGCGGERPPPQTGPAPPLFRFISPSPPLPGTGGEGEHRTHPVAVFSPAVNAHGACAIPSPSSLTLPTPPHPR